MLLGLNIRFAARLAPLAKSTTRPVLAHSVLVSRASTRSFWSSTHVEEPAKSTVKEVEEGGVKPERKKRVAKKPTKDKAEVKADAKKPKPVIIPKESMPPKNPRSAYFIFFVEFLQGHHIDGPVSLRATAVKGGEAWRAMSDEGRAPYLKIARAERDTCNEKRLEWFKQTDPQIIRQINKQAAGKGQRKLRMPKEPGQLSKPPASFLMYLQDRRAQQGDIKEFGTMKNFAKEAGKEWTNMTDEQKEPYRERFLQATKEYRTSKELQSSSE